MRWRNQLGANAGDVATSILQVAADPALGPFIDRLKTLHEIEVAAEANEPATTPGPPTVGIGLQNFLLPLDIYIFTKQHKIATIAIVAGVLFGIGHVGYKIGRRRAKAA
jgi:hypothetical protein